MHVLLILQEPLNLKDFPPANDSYHKTLSSLFAPSNMATSSSGATMPPGQSSVLLRLPNELLGEIASFLTIPELRYLGRISVRSKSFVDDYFRCRYTSAIFRLPDKILTKIAGYMDDTIDRSGFA